MDSAEEQNVPEQSLRRGFFQTLAKLGSAALVAVAGWKANPSRKLEAAPIPQVLDEPTVSVMLRMQADLEASLAGKLASRR